MAGLDRVTHSGRNVWRVRVYINKRRENIYLGNFDESDALIAKDHIAHILDATSRNRVPPRECVKWLDSLSKSSRDVYDRLVVLGLAEARAIVEAERTLIAYLRAYIKDRTDWKKPENYRQAVDKLETFLSKDVPLAVLKRSDANRWHRWMINDLKMSPNTAGQNVKRCRQILNQAVADRLIETNPFLGVKIDLKSDKTKNRYIDLGTTTAILNSCPNQEWRTIFALARFGGLRCPSEVLQLRWTDINWERSRFKVRSSKTERYGKGERIVPLWPELKTELDVLFAIVEPGVKVPLDAYVIQQYRQSESNLRTQLHRIADNAGVEKWPKPFMALRATRRTELERAGFKNHVLNNWFGHTGAIAEEHYLQVTEDDFAEANGATKISVAPLVAPSEADSTPSTPISPSKKPNKKRALMALSTLLMAMGIHPIGFEPITLGSEDRCAIQLRHGCSWSEFL